MITNELTPNNYGVVMPRKILSELTDKELEAMSSRMRYSLEGSIVPRHPEEDFLLRLVFKLGGDIKEKYLEELEDNNDFSLVVRPDKTFTIYTIKGADTYYTRYQIAHELGHYFLHALNMEQSKKETVVFPRFYPSEAETQADSFAKYFTLPRNAFKDMKKRYKGDMEALSEAFGVPIQIVAQRMDEVV